MSAHSPFPASPAVAFAVEGTSVANATGPSTMTGTALQSVASPGMALGAASAVAAAQQSYGLLPTATAATDASAVGGDVFSSASTTMGLSFLKGPAPVTVATSLTFVSSSGGEPLASHDHYSAIDSSLHPIL